jgi:hypothetical protein
MLTPDPLRHKLVSLVDSRIASYVVVKIEPQEMPPANVSNKVAMDFVINNPPKIIAELVPTQQFIDWAKEHEFEHSFFPGNNVGEIYIQAENYRDFFFFKLSW